MTAICNKVLLSELMVDDVWTKDMSDYALGNV